MEEECDVLYFLARPSHSSRPRIGTHVRAVVNKLSFPFHDMESWSTSSILAFPSASSYFSLSIVISFTLFFPALFEKQRKSREPATTFCGCGKVDRRLRQLERYSRPRTPPTKFFRQVPRKTFTLISFDIHHIRGRYPSPSLFQPPLFHSAILFRSGRPHQRPMTEEEQCQCGWLRLCKRIPKGIRRLIEQ